MWPMPCGNSGKKTAYRAIRNQSDIPCLKQCSPFGWLDSVGIVKWNVETWRMYLIYGSAIMALLGAATAVFSRKHLPI